MGGGERGWSLERWLLLATLTASVLTFVFGAGAQWAKTTAVEARVSALQETMVRRDVYNANQQRLSEAIDRLTSALDKVVERNARVDAAR